MTGRYPATHHVHRNGNEDFPENEVLIPKIFADNGYHCGLIGKLHLSRAQNIIEKRHNDGYQEFYYSHHPYPDGPEPGDYATWLKHEKGVDIKELYRDIKGHYGSGVQEEYHQTTWCGEMASRFIEKNNEPWFLSINLFDPHPPFDPPAEYLERYNSEKLPLPLFKENDMISQERFNGIDRQIKEAVNIFELDDDNIQINNTTENDGISHSSPPTRYNPRKVKACYYASIELIDFQIGKIIDTLKDKGQLENTIIIFMSDHGELLGDHGLLYKGCRFYEGLVHVPLIMTYKGSYKKGLKSDTLVELVDIAPTLLQSAGIEIPYYIQGKSLLPVLQGNIEKHKSHVICEYNDALDLPDGTHGSMYFDGRYKIVVYHGKNVGEIYDLKNDPGEFNNLWDKEEYRELKSDLLLKHFDAMMASSSAGIRRSGKY